MANVAEQLIMLRSVEGMMLETHDPRWAEKWDRAHAMMRALEAREALELTVEERDQLDKLRRLLPVVWDARHRTANDYIRFHLSLTLKEADELGIWAWLPQLSDSADIDEAKAAVAEVVTYVDRVKQRRAIRAACRRARIKPDHLPALSPLSWRTRWAMLRFRLGRARRSRQP